MGAKENARSGFSDAERKAMNARSRELAAEKRADRKRSEGEAAVLEVIADMPESDRILAERVHELVTLTVPELWPKTWYGMPAYSIGGKKVVCFFQSAAKFEARYATFGFNDIATIDEGSMWPTSFGLKRIGEVEAKRIVELLSRAVPKA